MKEIGKYRIDIPQHIHVKLDSVIDSARDVREVMLSREDSPHQTAHVLDTLFIFNLLADRLNIDSVERDLGRRSIRLHDTGYRFVESGDLQPEEHHFGSEFIAGIVDPDPRVLFAIRHHIEDILPDDIPMWIRLVRDSDRISALGFAGANRLVNYFGYRDTELEELGQEEIVRRGVYCV